MLTSAKRIPTMFATTTARTAVRSARAIGSVAGTSAPAVLRAQSTTARAVAPLFLDLASRQPASHSLAHAPARFISIDSISGRELETPSELSSDFDDAAAHDSNFSLFEEGLAFDLFGTSGDDARSKKAWSKPEKPLVKTAKRPRRAKFEAMSEQIVQEGVSQGVNLAVRSARETNRQVRKLVRRVTASAMAEAETELALEPLYLQDEQPRPRGRR